MLGTASLPIGEHRKPPYLDAMAPSSNAIAGIPSGPAPAMDQFSYEPATDGAIPNADPDCAPDGRFPIESINLGVRITSAGTPVEIARLRVPNQSNYDTLAIQWWVDYPFLYDAGGVVAQIRIANGNPINIPLPTYGPLVIPECVKPGQTIVLYVTVSAAIDVSDGASGNVIYAGGSLQAGYDSPQWFLRTADRARPMNSVRSATVLIVPGAPLTNPFTGLVLVASRVRVIWPVTTGPPAVGNIAISTFSPTFGVQAITTIDQLLGHLDDRFTIPMSNLSELLLGSPPGFGLVAPASVVVEWDVWRIR